MPTFDFRERQSQELEKHKEKDRIDRLERDKHEREKLERDRQEKERELEKERQEQALHNHFEKSLRAAQQRVSLDFKFTSSIFFRTQMMFYCICYS